MCPLTHPPTNRLLPSQLLNQVLNRVTAERNLFDRVVTLRLPGENLESHTAWSSCPEPLAWLMGGRVEDMSPARGSRHTWARLSLLFI